MEKTWCKHIVYAPKLSTLIPLRVWALISKGHTVIVPRTWKVCPICQAERPTRANIQAAELRFAMDNDQ